MRRVLCVVVTMVVLFVGGDRLAFAASKSIKQLPADLARWSMMWTAIPQQMVEVGQEHGPLAGLMWGPAQGAAALVESAVKEVWETAKLDRKPRPHSQGQHSQGALLRYEF